MFQFYCGLTIYKQSGDESIQWIDPNVCLEYMLPLEPFVATKNDFKKNVLSYVLFQNEISLKKVQAKLAGHMLYGADISDFEKLLMKLGRENSASNSANIDISKWQEFPIGDLFDITGSKTTKKLALNLDAGGDYPYITTAATNNGVAGYSQTWTEEGNIITVDSATDGVAFYQDKDFSASDHVEKLIPKFEMNVFKALFIVSILNINSKRYRYGYDRKRSQTALKTEVLYLPVNSHDMPDYNYMEKFIKSVSYTELL